MDKLKQLCLVGVTALALFGCSTGSNEERSSNGQNRLVEQVELTPEVANCCADTFQLQLLHFADIDGGRDILNNAVRFSAILDAFRAEYPNTIVLSSGDNWIPGPEYNVGSDPALAGVLGLPGNGRAHIAYLNAMGLQASAVGNHELDLGTNAFAHLIRSQSDGDDIWLGAQFPYLSANLDFSTDTNLAPLVASDASLYNAMHGKVAGSSIVLVNGEPVGVVGAVTPTLATIASTGDMTVLPADQTNIASLVAEIQAQVDLLKSKGINKIILLAHMQQIAVEMALAPLLDGVDILVAGGSNTLFADKNDRLRDGDKIEDNYPVMFKSAVGEPIAVVNTDGDYTYLGRLVVKFDQSGVMIPSLLDDTVNGAYATDEAGLVENGLTTADAIPAVQAVSDGLKTALQAKVGTVFGNTSVYLNGERGSVRTEETNLGNLSADANLAYAQLFDSNVTISLKNGGGIRAPIGACLVPPGGAMRDVICKAPPGTPGINSPGDITQLDMEISLRFNNALSLVSITGEQLKQILEHSVAATANGATPGQFPQVSGIRFSFDPTETAQTVDTSGSRPVVDKVGSRIRNLVVLDNNGAQAGGELVTIVKNGVLDPVAALQTFRLVTLNYLANGGVGFPFPTGAAANVLDLEMPGRRTGDAKVADDGTEQDALAEYLFSNFPDAASAFSQVDLPAAEDSRIQNLAVVPIDTILTN